jgi:signal transduction histidine kinase
VTASGFLAATLYFVPALVWAIIARQLWAYLRTGRPPSPTFNVFRLTTSAIALHLASHVALALLPAGAPSALPVALGLTRDLTLVGSLALGRHAIRLLPVPERPPGRAWLAANYGFAASVGLALTFARALSPPALALSETPGALCALPLGLLCLWEGWRGARPGAWGPEGAIEMRQPDVALVGWGIGGTVVASLALAAAGQLPFALVLLDVGISLAIAVPIALRVLGVVVPDVLVTVTLLAAAGGVLVAHTALAAHLEPRDLPLLHFAGALALALVFMPGQAWLRAATERLVLRRSRQQQAALQGFLHTLSPELGTRECCRRALAELVRVRRVAGAAVILDDGEGIAHGDFDLAPLLDVWPRGPAADALPARSFGSIELRALPLALREALVQAHVMLGAAPILSPRRRWGWLFMNTGMLGGLFHEDDVEGFRALVAQLALLLDAADLLTRTVAVERTLAHAEKLAAIGELAARIAHEIRNPVAAARSLAQQLAREPGTPGGGEHRLILEELERVERQVGELLRFARREELRFEPVDLGELARATLHALHPRLEAAGIAVALEAAPGVVARADRDKLRQVLVNLLENARDALATSPAPRWLTVAVRNGDVVATLAVTDNGPGVPSDALPRLFEPFFSTKPTGTGLGLAIARHAVRAHGGAIVAAPAEGAGLTIRVTLPLAEAP